MAQLGAWSEVMRKLDRVGIAPMVELDRAEIRERTGSTAYLGGVLERRAGVVQPALVAKALRMSAVAGGTQVFEGSPATSVARQGRGVSIETPHGEISAQRVVLAHGAWIARLPALRRHLFVVSSDMVATKPDPAGLLNTGIPQGLALSDSRMQVNYLQATLDGRLVWGRGGGALAFANRVGGPMLGRPARWRRIVDAIHDTYPSLGTLEVDTAWAGPVDRSPSGLPLLGFLDSNERIAFAAGLSGNGVAPAAVTGRMLAGLVCDGSCDWPWGPGRWDASESFPPEPIRFLGAALVRAAVRRKERADARDRGTDRITRKLVALSPGGSKE
jgi:glycine/D-amino acid oxidase-like deaminating enzyme